MERQQILLPVRALILATLLVSSIAVAQDGEPQGPAEPAAALAPLGTGFTYQGRLDQGGSPVNDDCDMGFRLYDQATGGAQVGSAITATVPITDGLFTVTLDFGASAFTGDRRWLGIAVDCEGGGTYADLGRQELTAAPHALYAMGAPWSGLTGVPAGFADSVDDDTIYSAGDGLVLDGTEFSAQGSPYANVVVVAQSGGDYTSVQVAIDSITDAAEGNPYLVWVAPGVYSETVTMKPYVHLQGAGQEATVISSTVSSGSAWPPTQATLVLASDASLRDLTVSNGGTGDSNTALLATAGMTRTLVADVTARTLEGGVNNYAIFLSGSGTGVTLQQVTALAENGSGLNSGLINFSGAAAVLRGGSFTSRGGEDAWGIFNTGITTTLEAESVTVLAENGSDRNFGLYNWGGPTAVLYGGSFTGRGGSTTRGIENADSGAKLTAESVTALAENGSTDNFGFGSYDSATTTLRGGTFTGRGGADAYGVSNGANGATLEVESVTALAESGSSNNYGMFNFGGGVTTLRGGSFTGRGGITAYGIYNEESSTTLEATGVTALGENGSNYNFGLYNYNSAKVVLYGGSFTGRGGSVAWGIYNHSSGTTLKAVGITALGENSSSNNRGLHNTSGAEANLYGGSFTGHGGERPQGIRNTSVGSMLEAEGVTALGENGSVESFGLEHRDSAITKINNSVLTGSTAGLYLDSGTVYLGVTQLDSGASKGGGTLTCFQVYDGSYASYTCP